MKKGDGKGFSHAQGGGQKRFWQSFSVEVRGLSHTGRGGGGTHKSFHLVLRRGATSCEPTIL